MTFDDTTRGAMPRPSAMLEPAGRSGGPISWPRILRDAEGTQSGANGGSGAGATPGTGSAPTTTTTSGQGATPGTTTTTPGGTAPGEPATDYPEGLGDAGKRALDAMKAARQTDRDRAKTAEDRAAAAEKERDDLRAATQTDQEKALTTAKREAEAGERTKWTDRIRATEVRSSLRAAGVTNDKALAYLAGATAFASLKVADDGSVTGLSEAVEAMKKDMPEAFGAAAPNPGPGGPWGGSEGGSGRKEPGSLDEAIADQYANPKPR